MEKGQYLFVDYPIWQANPDIFCMKKPLSGSELASADQTCL